jgi:hypothetical protein
VASTPLSGLAPACWWPAAWAEALLVVATNQPGRRGRAKRSADELQGDGLQWPGYRQQLQLRAHIPEAEQLAAEQRAQVLVSQGWGALQAWLEAPGPQPGERPAQPLTATQRARRQLGETLADLFDAA